MPTTNQADHLLAGLSESEQRLVLLIERRLEQRLTRRLDGKVGAIRKAIDRIIVTGELEDAVAHWYEDDDDDNDDHEEEHDNERSG